MSELWVYAERAGDHWHESALETLFEAKTLAAKSGMDVAALVLRSEDDGAIDDLGQLGVGKVYMVRVAAGSDPNISLSIKRLAGALRAQAPALLLGAGTPHTNLVFATVGSRLSLPIVPECTHITIKGDTVELVRPVYGGKLDATLEVDLKHTIMATLRSRGGPLPGVGSCRPALVDIALACDPEPPIIRELGVIRADPSRIDLSEAEIIVAGGRGVGSREGFVALERLASALGASVGGSRVAVDEGWLAFERQIGQTGKIVAPKLYLACGISGAVYHAAGIRDSKLIVAINTDRHAPIMKMADVGIVGDLREIVPALTMAVLKAKQDHLASPESPARRLFDALQTTGEVIQ